MFDFIFNFHSGWRYVVILATVLVAVYFLYALVTKATSENQEKVVLKWWGRFFDIQVTLGIILLLFYVLTDDYDYYGKLTGHWVMGLLASMVATSPTIYRWLNGEPSTQTRRMMGVILPIVVFIIIFLGISAIDRGMFEMTG